MGIGRDSWHKRRKTGGRKPQMHKKRKFELGRPASNTKISPKRVHTVRTMGGNMKFRALRLDTVTSVGPAKEFPEPPGLLMLSTTPLPTNWSEPKPWSKVPSLPSMLPHSDNSTSPTTPKPSAERIPTNFLKKKPKPSTTSITAAQRPRKKYANRQKTSDVAANLNTQFLQGKVLAKINSRPGQCGRADGYILEGEELDFYVKKLKTKKSKA